MGLFGGKKEAPKPAAADIGFLNVGTQSLTKDVMDQYIRTLGNHRTHYAITADMARRILKENPIDFMFLEYEISDCTGFRLLKEIRSIRAYDGIYVVLVTEEDNDHIRALSQEMDVDTVLYRPFNAHDLKAEIEKYKAYKEKEINVGAKLRKAHGHFRDKMFQQAAKLYQECLEMDPESVQVQYKYGMYMLSKPDFPNAEKHLKKAFTIDPEHIPTLTGLGQLSYRQKKFRKAHEFLQRAQALSPLNPDRALVLSKLTMEIAAEDLRVAHRKDTTNPDLMIEIAKISLIQKDYSSAMKLLSAVKLPPKHPKEHELSQLRKVVSALGSIKS